MRKPEGKKSCFINKIFCFFGIHCKKRLCWPVNPKNSRVFYWFCGHCHKIIRGGVQGYYYQDSSNYGQTNFPLTKKEIQDIIEYDKQQPPELPDCTKISKKLSLDDIKKKFGS